LNLYGAAREQANAGEASGTTLAQRERRRQSRMLQLVHDTCATLTVDPCSSQISAGTVNQ
jgi:hypothetical protein